MKNIFLSEGVVDPELHKEKKQIYILGTDNNAKKIFLCLLQYKVCILGFVERKMHNKNKLYGLPVMEAGKTEQFDAVYVADRDNYRLFQEMIDESRVYLADMVYCDKNEFVFEENDRTRKCNAALMVQMILSRTEKRRPVFLIPSNQREFWENLATVLKEAIGDSILLTLDQEEETIYDVMYYDVEKIVIFVCTFETEDITKILTTLGLKQTYHYLYLYNSFSGHVTDKYYGFDWYLGNSFMAEKDVPGFYIHGDMENSKKKVVLLGNSATDPLFYPQKSWPQMLWEQCEDNQIVIYNGAVTDYSSTNEALKLLRDVLLLKPNLVISYSGIIDFREYVPGYPYLNLNLMRTSRKWQDGSGKEVIYGIKDNRTAYERWLNNETMMHTLCQMEGITFWGILQPWIGSEREDAGEKLQVWSDNYWSVAFPQFSQFVSNAREFKEKIHRDVEEYSWLYDFTDIFAEIDDADIYYDSIHVNEDGNAIVAKKIGGLFRLL